MADLRGAWNETGDRLTELGRKLKVHYEQQHGGDEQQSRQELADAARRVGGAVQDAFEALGSAARDKDVQSDVRQVGQSLVEAIGVTLGQASVEVRRALSERKGDAGASATAPAAPTVVEGDPPGESEGPRGDDGDGDQPPKVEPWGTP